MNMHNAEQLRQHNDYKAIQARLWGKKTAETKAEPVVVKEPKRKLIQLDYHVWLYRKFKIRYGAFVTTKASFSVTPYQNYTPYEPRVVFDMEPVRKTMKQIALEVLDIYPGVSLAELKGSHRHKSIVEARQRAMYECQRQRPDLSYPAIGRFFEKDHTTVIHAVRKITAIKARAAA